MRPKWRGRAFDSQFVAQKIGQCDLFLSLNPWHSPSIDRLLKFLAPALSIGFFRAFDVALPKDPARHAVDQAFGVPAHFDASLRVEDYAFPPRLPARCRPRVREFLRSVAPGKRILAVHNESKAEKVWPRERLNELIDRFLERHREFSVFVLDFKKPEASTERFKDRVIHSPGLPLPYAFTVVGESDLFLGVDSCMLHAADLFRIPGVGLFGAARIPFGRRKYKSEQWGFRFARHRHVSELRGIGYMGVQEVFVALESLVNENRGREKG